MRDPPFRYWRVGNSIHQLRVLDFLFVFNGTLTIIIELIPINERT